MRSTSPQETAAAAAAVAASVRPGEVLLLVGGLGAGKTTFAKGFGAALGVHELVTSPTFTLVRTYQGTDLTLVHVDAYRLAGPGDWEDLGVDELMSDPERPAVALIEWGDVVEPAIRGPRRRLHFAWIDEHVRDITCS